MTRTIPWHHDPRAQRLLRLLTPQNTVRARVIAIPCDFHARRGLTWRANAAIEALERIRQERVEQVLGFTFADAQAANDADRRAAYLAVDDLAPTVSDVIEEALAARAQRQFPTASANANAIAYARASATARANV